MDHTWVFITAGFMLLLLVMVLLHNIPEREFGGRRTAKH